MRSGLAPGAIPKTHLFAVSPAGVPPENRNRLISLKIPPPGVKLYERSTRPGMKQHRCPAGSLGLRPLRHPDLRGIGDQHEASSPLSVLLALDGVPPSPLPPTGGRGTAPPAGGVSENVPAPRIQPADRILWSLLSADSLQRSPSRRPAAEVLPASPASMPKAAMRPSWEGRVEGEPTC